MNKFCLYFRGLKTTTLPAEPARPWIIKEAAQVFRFWKPRALARGASFFLNIIIFLSSFLVYAQNQDRLLEYNLGKISSDKPIKQKYKFYEEIKSTLSLCECVKTNVYKKEEPGKENLWIVNVEFDPQGYSGDVSQDVLLLDKNDKLITLRLKAFVE
jgi:hypothetical protein